MTITQNDLAKYGLKSAVEVLHSTAQWSTFLRKIARSRFDSRFPATETRSSPPSERKKWDQWSRGQLVNRMSLVRVSLLPTEVFVMSFLMLLNQEIKYLKNIFQLKMINL